MEKVGKEGVITVEEARGIETTLETVDGMQFDRGYISPYFVTDSEKMKAVLTNPLILIHEKKISSMQDMLPTLEAVARAAASNSSRSARVVTRIGSTILMRKGSKRLWGPLGWLF